MAILDKIKQPPPQEGFLLTVGDIEFLLVKMRTADYKGAEFEAFYNIYAKLSRQLEALKKQ